MLELIHKLHVMLNDLKRFHAGYTSRNNSSMLVQMDNKVFRLDVTELGEGEVESYMDQLKS